MKKYILYTQVCHGDIKAENILITGWNWLLLTDFASFKPTTLPYVSVMFFASFKSTSLIQQLKQYSLFLFIKSFFDPTVKTVQFILTH